MSENLNQLSAEIPADMIANLSIDAIDREPEESREDQPAEQQEAPEDEEDRSSEAELQPGDIEDEAEPAEENEKPVDVTLKDGTKVTLAELESGYLRNADYTRKTQEVAQQRRDVQQAQERLTTIDQEVKANLDLAVEVLKAYLPRQPDPSMIEADPQGYLRSQAAYNQAVGQLNELVQAQRQSQSRDGEMSAQQQQDALRSEMQLLASKAPDLAKPEDLVKFRDEAIEWGAKAYGLSSEEIGQLQDHREIMILRDAIKYRQLLAKKAGTIETARKAPPVMRPGVARPAGQQQQRTREHQVNRLRQTGSIDDALSLIGDV